MAEIEVDLFMYCENPECEGSPDEADCFNGDESETFQWRCPTCKTDYEFEVEFEPTVSNLRKAKKNG
ncbi:hypothetical protein [Vibrio sp. D431a]|uniref:hypothetical protein n=1 Tax=Vibrio sp. D431a TaxID=2837388 RepID=UPI002557ACD4|nr:hypothetical protein [Vibrio sp. D431a]MDK9793328.1 hypothetical protein [Vibrio sp. D431a]